MTLQNLSVKRNLLLNTKNGTMDLMRGTTCASLHKPFHRSPRQFERVEATARKASHVGPKYTPKYRAQQLDTCKDHLESKAHVKNQDKHHAVHTL